MTFLERKVARDLATISQILKNQKIHLEAYDSGIPGKHKTMRKPDFPEIESTLYEWFTKMTRLNVQTSRYYQIFSCESTNT